VSVPTTKKGSSASRSEYTKFDAAEPPAPVTRIRFTRLRTLTAMSRGWHSVPVPAGAREGCHASAATPMSLRGKPSATLLIAPVLFAVACGSSGPSATGRPIPVRRWFVVDAATRSVSLTLFPGGSVSSGKNFNGYSRGEMVVRVPRGWRVTVHCRNTVSSAPHSCAIVNGSLSTTPAFPGATTADPIAGVPPGRSNSFTFVPRRSGGNYLRIASLVDDDELNGMWEGFSIGGRHTNVAVVSRFP
jgi:hypothetical protein